MFDKNTKFWYRYNKKLVLLLLITAIQRQATICFAAILRLF